MSIIGLAAVVPLAGAAEPNDDVTTAEGPLTAGKTFNGSLETATDGDFHFFYLPDTTAVTVTTINAAKKGTNAEDRGRTIVSSLLRARKGKLPLPIADSARVGRAEGQEAGQGEPAAGQVLHPGRP